VRIQEFLPACVPNDTTAQFIELVATTEFDRYSADLRLRIEDSVGGVRLDAGNLFGLAHDGEPWTTGDSWLLATQGLEVSNGITADVRIPGALDPQGGRLVLYDGRPGGPILQDVAYGPATPNPLPTPGSSLERSSDDLYHSSSPPHPRKASGATPVTFHCPELNEQVVLREFALACVNGSTGGQFIELEAPVDQHFARSMRLITRDRDGNVIFSVNDLFPGRPEGGLWPAGHSWLIAPIYSGGAPPDRYLNTLLDRDAGSIELYGGNSGGILLGRAEYGAGRPVASPPNGHSIERDASGTYVVDGSPSPTNFAGGRGGGTACFCPSPACAPTNPLQLRIDEVALLCANGELTTQFLELRSIAPEQAFRASTRLTATDHNGAVIFDVGNLFPGQAEGAPWSEGTAWLLGAASLDSTSGVLRDLPMPGSLDLLGGTLTLYDSRPGGHTAHVVSYGSSGSVAAPGRGESIQRGPDDALTIVPQQEPENHGGTRQLLQRCPCVSVALALANGPYIYSNSAARDTANGASRVSYDLRVGTGAVSISNYFDSKVDLRAGDVFTVLGPNAGQPVSIRATMHFTGDGHGTCGVHCSAAGGGASLMWNGTRAATNLGKNVNKTIELAIQALVGQPWHLDWTLGAEISSSGLSADAGYTARVAFLDVPPGSSITSCAGFRYDGPTATLPSVAQARADGDGVHVEWYVSEDLNAVVERTEGAESWQPLGVPTRASNRLTFDDRAVTPGAHYGYRLSWSEAGAPQFSDVAWVDVPAGKLALRALSANPSRGTPVLEYTMPVMGSVRLELTDLRGRRVWMRDLGIQPAGVHRVDATAGPVLAPGIYWARLIRTGEQALLKLIVLGR
jgi:hypothetical protein